MTYMSTENHFLAELILNFQMYCEKSLASATLPLVRRYCPGVGIHLKNQREANFPLEVAKARAGVLMHLGV